MTIPSKTRSYLDSRKVKYEVVAHKTVFTAYDLAQTTKTPLSEIAKTLLVKADGTYWLALVRAADRIDLAKLKKTINAKKVSIVDEKEMTKALTVKPGALTPFAGMHKLSAVIDRVLTKMGKALFGSGSFEFSIRMRVADYAKMERPVVGAFGQSAKLTLQVKPKKPRRR